MKVISQFLTEAYSFFASISYDLLIVLPAAVLGGIFLLTAFACAVSAKIRAADKKPFFHLLNALTAVAFAVFLMGFELEKSALFAALFWCAGYLLYGLLCAITKPEKKQVQPITNVVSALPASTTAPIGGGYVDMPAAKSSVRLEHALSITDKLLLKNLGKGDRQELEKMKTTLTVLQIKGSLTPQEGEILNENFNALLKLMAKYNV